jgi:hypothetical protein
MLFEPLSPRIFKANFYWARGVNSNGIATNIADRYAVWQVKSKSV